MTIAVIDHATITSVRRSLGAFSIERNSNIDLDHAALERFCNAILLHDHVIVPDTYKTELREERNRYLRIMDIEPRPVPDNLDSEIKLAASSIMEQWFSEPTISDPNSSAIRYLQRIDSYFYSEGFSGSGYFVLSQGFHSSLGGKECLRVLLKAANEKETINNQVVANVKKNLNFSSGIEKRINKTDGLEGTTAKSIDEFGKSISWVAYRYLWYQIFAAQLNASYFPHPLRDFFALEFVTKTGLVKNPISSINSGLLSKIYGFTNKYTEAIKAVNIEPPSVNMQLRGFLPLIVSRSSDGGSFLNELRQLRNSPEVSTLRNKLNSIQTMLDQGSFKGLKELQKDIEAIGDDLILTKGIKEKFISVTIPTSLVGIKFESDNLRINLRLPPLLFKNLFLGKKYFSFIRNALEEVSAISQYGALKTKLNGFRSIRTGYGNWVKDNGKNVYVPPANIGVDEPY